jgi:hypothetical protein
MAAMRSALPFALAFLVAVPALAQEEPAPEIEPEKPAPRPTGLDMTPDDEGKPITEPVIPERPEDDRPRAKKPPKPRYTKDDYPIEHVARPLTLAAGQAQIVLELPLKVNGGNPTFGQTVSGAFGVTRDLELGLTYGIGLLLLDPETTQDTYEPGKAVSIDGLLTIFPDLLAAQVRLGFFFDSDLFGMSFTVGLPVRVRLMKQWILFAGADLLTVKLTGLPVYVRDPAANLGQVAFDAQGGVTSRGSVDLTIGSAYQLRPDLSVAASFGFHWPDFEQDDQPISFYVGATWSPVRIVDLGLRLGFERLDESDSFAAVVHGALRL